MCLGSIWCQRESSVLTLKNDLSQQDFREEKGAVGGGNVCGSHQQCADSQTEAAEEGIIRITHTQIYKYTHQRTNIYVQKAQIHSIRHEKLSARLLAQKKKERKSHLTDIFNLKQSMTSWPPVMLNW